MRIRQEVEIVSLKGSRQGGMVDIEFSTGIRIMIFGEAQINKVEHAGVILELGVAKDLNIGDIFTLTLEKVEKP